MAGSSSLADSVSPTRTPSLVAVPPVSDVTRLYLLPHPVGGWNKHPAS